MGFVHIDRLKFRVGNKRTRQARSGVTAKSVGINQVDEERQQHAEHVSLGSLRHIRIGNRSAIRDASGSTLRDWRYPAPRTGRNQVSVRSTDRNSATAPD